MAIQEGVKPEFIEDFGEIQMWPDEVDFVYRLIDKMPDDGVMVEWGGGASTILWLKRLKPTQKLISIEHNINWYNKLVDFLNDKDDINTDNFDYVYVAPKYGNYDHGYGTVKEEHPTGLGDYIAAGVGHDADIYFCDGIARSACALAALAKSGKKKPSFLIHDYDGRENWYDWVIPLFPKAVVGPINLLQLYK